MTSTPTTEAAATEPESSAAQPSLAREVVGGVLAAAIALGCLLPPLVHFVTGPLGPGIGAFVVAQHLKPEPRGRAVIAGTLGVSLSALVGAIALAIAEFSGPKGPPDWFPSGGTLMMVLFGVVAYGAALGALGAAIAGRNTERRAS